MLISLGQQNNFRTQVVLSAGRSVDRAGRSL
jgi:hypothetical protein